MPCQPLASWKKSGQPLTTKVATVSITIIYSTLVNYTTSSKTGSLQVLTIYDMRVNNRRLWVTWLARAEAWTLARRPEYSFQNVLLYRIGFSQTSDHWTGLITKIGILCLFVVSLITKTLALFAYFVAIRQDTNDLRKNWSHKICCSTHVKFLDPSI